MTTDHFPECPMLDERYPKHPLEKCDYCEMLRACEQRVEAEWLDRYNYDPDIVWEDALDVARQAVKEICQQNPLIWPTDEAAMQALDAAITVLKEGGTKEYKVRSTWSAALDAAREAASNTRGWFTDEYPDSDGIALPVALIEDVVNRIDALRNPPSLPPTKGRAHKY